MIKIVFNMKIQYVKQHWISEWHFFLAGINKLFRNEKIIKLNRFVKSRHLFNRNRGSVSSTLVCRAACLAIFVVPCLPYGSRSRGLIWVYGMMRQLERRQRKLTTTRFALRKKIGPRLFNKFSRPWAYILLFFKLIVHFIFITGNCFRFVDGFLFQV